METVILKNGTEEVAQLVATIMHTLREMEGDMANGGPICIYELVQMCRDRNHKPFGTSGEKLERLNLINGGQVHDSIRNIVLSAIEGDGLDVTLGDPVKG